MPPADLPIIRRVPARVGLVGNPSDGYGGAVLATVLPSPAAEVSVHAAAGVQIGSRTWASVDAWRDHVEEHGLHGTERLIDAALWTLVEHLGPPVPAADGVAVRWATDIPRSVGLAGSSALAVGVIDAAAARWGFDLDRRVLAALALRTERDVLGIAAGWQDRIVQAFGRTVLVDAATLDVVDGVEVPVVRVVDTPAAGTPAAGAELLVAWAEHHGADSHTYHGPLRARSAELAGPMGELAALARTAGDAWAAGDLASVGAAMDAGWRLRQAHVPLPDAHAALVELVRGAGLPATTPGSGGSVVALCADRAATDRAVTALAGRGCATRRFVVR